MTFKYAVTFESLTQPPRTFRGTVEAGMVGTASRRAIEAALKAKGRSRYCSVLCLLDLPEGAEEEAQDDNVVEATAVAPTEEVGL